MEKKERYQINIRVKKEKREQVDSAIVKTGKNLTAVILEGFDLFEKKHKISSNDKA